MAKGIYGLVICVKVTFIRYFRKKIPYAILLFSIKSQENQNKSASLLVYNTKLK